MELVEKMNEDLKNSLSEKRYTHSLGVMNKAVELAKKYGVNENDAKIAGLLHDIAKEMTVEESLNYIEKNNIQIDEIERKNSPILHGKIGADIVKKKYNLPQNIQNAIIYHTTTNVKMDMLAKIIYVADKIEDGRTSKEYDIEYERYLADKDIDLAILHIINENIKSLISKNKLIHPNSIEMRNKILLKFL